MSPPNHTEYKHARDHKDIDLFVEPENIAVIMTLLKSRGFKKVWTKYDKLPSAEDFRRYEKRHCLKADSTVKITIDFFVRSDVPVRIIDGWRVTEPSFLLSLYGSIHSSDKCFAVKGASELLNKGTDPVGRQELTELPVHAKPVRSIKIDIEQT